MFKLGAVKFGNNLHNYVTVWHLLGYDFVALWIHMLSNIDIL